MGGQRLPHGPGQSVRVKGLFQNQPYPKPFNLGIVNQSRISGAEDDRKARAGGAYPVD